MSPGTSFWRPLSLEGYRTDRGGRLLVDVDKDSFLWLTKGLGIIWQTHLQGPEEVKEMPPPHPIDPGWLVLDADSPIILQSGQTTRLRIEIPEDLESRIQQLVESTTDPAEFAKATLSARRPLVPHLEPQAAVERGTPETSPFFRETKITVLGTEPLPADEAEQAMEE
jgi:hypothetical protein